MPKPAPKPKPKPKPVKPDKRPKPTKPVTGKVVSVGTDTLTLKKGNQFQTLTVAPDTVITLDGNTATLADLKAGMQIKALLSGTTTREITAHSKEEEPPAPAPPTPPPPAPEALPTEATP